MKKIMLKDLFSIRKGKKVEPVEAPSDDTVRYIQIEDLRDNSNPKFCLPKESYVFANKNHIIIAWDGANAGTVSYGLEGAIGSTLAILETREKNVFIPYVGKFLQSKNQYLRDTCTGATIPHISRKALENIVIPLPSVERQKYISNTLDKAKSLIVKRKAQIEALDQLTQSVFLEMFGDPLRNNKNLPVVPLSNLAEIIMGQSPKGDSYNTKGDGTPLLNGPTEFGNTYPKEKQWTTNPKKICFKDDILFCVRGATAGRMNFADKEYCIGRGLAAIRCNNKNDIPFIYQTLKFLYKYFQSTSNGSTFINIDKKTLQNVPVLQVDNVQLEKYFTTIKKIEEQKKVLSESILLLEENYNSIMQRAFKGELFTEEKVSNL